MLAQFLAPYFPGIIEIQSSKQIKIDFEDCTSEVETSSSLEHSIKSFIRSIFDLVTMTVVEVFISNAR